MRRVAAFAVVAALFLIMASAARAQERPDAQLMQEINSMAAIDNHTHVLKVVRTGEKDDDYDALPCSPFTPA